MDLIRSTRRMGGRRIPGGPRFSRSATTAMASSRSVAPSSTGSMKARRMATTPRWPATIRCSFTKVVPGTYMLREVVAPGQSQTLPGPNSVVPFTHMVTVLDRPITGMDFGDTISDDFGDAPDSYGTTLAANGPRHGILAGF